MSLCDGELRHLAFVSRRNEIERQQNEEGGQNGERENKLEQILKEQTIAIARSDMKRNETKALLKQAF